MVYATYYESYDYLLIDNGSGAITHTWGLPVISPDGHHFVTVNKDLLAGFTSNGIQLYKNKSSPKLLGEHLLDKWGSDDIKWVNNTTLVVKASVSDTISENLEHTEYFRLKFKE